MMYLISLMIQMLYPLKYKGTTERTFLPQKGKALLPSWTSLVGFAGPLLNLDS